MSRLLLPFALLISHFSLINHTAANIQVNSINIGGGFDELELLLKTPGRLISNPGLNSFSSIAAVTAHLSRWQVPSSVTNNTLNKTRE